MSRQTPEDSFEIASRRLLDGFDAWAGDTDAVGDARFALDYKRASGEHRLEHWTHDDVDDLLLGYLPAKVLLEPDQAREVVTSIGLFFEYLETTGRMAEDSDPADDLVAHIEGHVDEFLEAMADPERGGHSKRILMAMLADEVDLGDTNAVNAWIEAFNAGPIEERDRILGSAPEYELDEGAEIVLPVRPEVDIDVARRSAAEAPILVKFRALAEYLGEGKRLTEKGNLKLADARALVELVETGDEMDRVIGDHTYKTQSAANLIWLDMIVWWARQVGAVKVRDRRMSRTKTWLKRSSEPLVAMRQAVDVVVETGPLVMLMGDRYIDGVDVVMDATAVALLSKAYESEQPLEEFIEMMTSSIPVMVDLPSYYFGELRHGEEPYVKERVRWTSRRMVSVLEMAGLLVWRDGTLVPDRWGDRSVWKGGVLSITPFGEWVVQNYLVETGMVIAPVLATLTVDLDDPPDEIVVAMSEIVPAGPETLAQAWEALGGWEGLPEQLWRVDRPETEHLLEALGHALPDKATAKAARKALLKHRSWMAGRR